MNAENQHQACVGDIARIMESVAPPQLAEEWDNCGLQVGHSTWPVGKLWVALDPLPQVVQAAVEQQVDMLICHHPLIFKPLGRIDLETTVGAVIDTALRHRIAIYSAHTNLDSTSGGVNDMLAGRIGLTRLDELMPPDFTGAFGEAEDLGPPMGLGRIGQLDPPVTAARLARRIKTEFKLDRVRVAGNQEILARRVAVCSGSGGSLLGVFLQSDADVFISGDLKYHDARLVEDAGRCLIDVGHFASEHLLIGPLVEQLRGITASEDWQLQIDACTLERDPFDLI